MARCRKKMNKFKKAEKSEKRTGSDFIRATLERLSLRSRKKKRDAGKDCGYEVVMVVNKDHDMSTDSNDNDKIVSDKPPEAVVDNEDDVSKLEDKPPLPPARKKPLSTSSSFRSTTGPSSATSTQVHSISQLDSALRSFTTSVARSRENLSLARPD